MGWTLGTDQIISAWSQIAGINFEIFNEYYQKLSLEKFIWLWTITPNEKQMAKRHMLYNKVALVYQSAK